MQIKQLMKTDVPLLRPNEPIVDAVETLAGWRHDALPVATREGQLMGLLRTRDVLPILLGRSTRGRQVRHFMIRRFVSFEPGDGLEEACSEWAGGSGDSIVVTEGGAFAGILLRHDVLELIPRLRKVA